MTIDWQPATVPPTGMQYNPTDTSFPNLLYNFLIPLEAPTLTERLTLTPVINARGQSDLTIGVGFNLRTGKAVVQTLRGTGVRAIRGDVGRGGGPSKPIGREL